MTAVVLTVTLLLLTAGPALFMAAILLMARDDHMKPARKAR